MHASALSSHTLLNKVNNAIDPKPTDGLTTLEIYYYIIQEIALHRDTTSYLAGHGCLIYEHIRQSMAGYRPICILQGRRGPGRERRI
jgi:hypothetical protein